MTTTPCPFSINTVMKQRIALFWPGDGRDTPNQQALPSITEATLQMEAAIDPAIAEVVQDFR